MAGVSRLTSLSSPRRRSIVITLVTLLLTGVLCVALLKPHQFQGKYEGNVAITYLGPTNTTAATNLALFSITNGRNTAVNYSVGSPEVSNKGASSTNIFVWKGHSLQPHDNRNIVVSPPNTTNQWRLPVLVTPDRVAVVNTLKQLLQNIPLARSFVRPGRDLMTIYSAPIADQTSVEPVATLREYLETDQDMARAFEISKEEESFFVVYNKPYRPDPRPNLSAVRRHPGAYVFDSEGTRIDSSWHPGNDPRFRRDWVTEDRIRVRVDALTDVISATDRRR